MTTSLTRTIDPDRREITDPDILADIERWERRLAQYQAGELDEDVFRAFRLSTGVYGQRQGGTAQMLRVKIPYGSITADQLDTLGVLAAEFSRGFGHITTRQNFQFHFVELNRVTDAMRLMGAAGMFTREACGDTVRTIQGCHLAGACPYEVLDISAWAQAATNHLIRNPISQRLPRKFKINFSGCSTDCGQAMFNDIGVVAAYRKDPDGAVEAGFKVYVAGGLGANPHSALALEDFTPRELLIATLEAAVRVFDRHGNRDNKRRARMKWLVDTIGIEEVRRLILETRRTLPASARYPEGIPPEVVAAGDQPAGRAGGVDPTLIGHGTLVKIKSNDPYQRWMEANVIRGRSDGTVSFYAHARLGDITAAQFHALADLQRRIGGDIRLSNRQNIVFRGIDEGLLPEIHLTLAEIGMATPGAELLRDVVACPGADTCNLGVTQSRGLAKAIDEELDANGLSEVGGLRINISGCTNSCGQHHVADIGFHGAERRAHDRSAPGYQLLIGGHLGDEQVEFGDRVTRLPAKSVPQVVTRIVSAFNEERQSGEAFRNWVGRTGGIERIAALIDDLTSFPDPLLFPDYYIDYDESQPFGVSLGASECM